MPAKAASWFAASSGGCTSTHVHRFCYLRVWLRTAASPAVFCRPGYIWLKRVPIKHVRLHL